MKEGYVLTDVNWNAMNKKLQSDRLFVDIFVFVFYRENNGRK